MQKPETMYVFQSPHNLLWYFWDETGLRTIGGYGDKLEAQHWAWEYFNEIRIQIKEQHIK